MVSKAKISVSSFLISLHDLCDFLQPLYLLQLVDDCLHILTVMDTEFDIPVEDPFLAGDSELMDVDIHLRGDDTGDVHHHTHAVDTLQMDGGIEEESFVHIPFRIEDAVTVTGLEFGSDRTVALVNLYAVLVVDKAKDVVTRDGVTAMTELILSDIVVVDEDRFLPVELLRNDKQFLWRGIVFLLLVSAQERNKASPTFLAITRVLAL